VVTQFEESDATAENRMGAAAFCRENGQHDVHDALLLLLMLFLFLFIAHSCRSRRSFSCRSVAVPAALLPAALLSLFAHRVAHPFHADAVPVLVGRTFLLLASFVPDVRSLFLLPYFRLLFFSFQG